MFAELVDHSVVNVHVVDKDLRWLAVNRQARHDFHLLYGRTPEIGDYLPGLFEDGTAGQTPVLPMWQRALAGEQFIEIGTFGKPPALRHYELRFNALRDPEGEVHGAFLFAYDISERVQEQERLAKAEAALRQAQKMEAVGQLSGGIAHDFNNLLGGILGAQELMRQRLEQSRFDALAPLLELSSSAAQRASSLVHRLLAFSRQQTLQPCSTQVATLVAGMEDLLRRTIGPAITLSSRFASQLWPTFIDPPQLESALLNLCINARDAMPAGGVIEIIGDNLQLDDEQAVALELPASEFVRLSIVDNGSGMSAEVVERAVEPFFTTKPMGQGTGLGLSMTYGFVRQSGGQLRVLSVPGEGTRIELLLPRHHEQAQAPISKPPRALLQRSSETAKRILLVEDQTALRLVIGEVLEELGYRVDAFENGPSALTHLQSGERPDLLLSDVGLPGGLNGRQLAERCRERYPDLKVLLITGYDESAALSDGQPLQGTLVLTKPFELEALAERVRELLEP